MREFLRFDDAEIEMRLGRLRPKDGAAGALFWDGWPSPCATVVPARVQANFDARIQEKEFRVLLEWLMAEASRSADLVLYKNGERTIDYSRPGRPRVTEHARSGEVLEVVHKSKKTHLNVLCPGGRDLRLTCCRETKLPSHQDGGGAGRDGLLEDYRDKATHVRQKRRWAFRFHLFEIDLTEVTEGKRTQFEAEIEVADVKFFRSNRPDYWVLKMWENAQLLWSAAANAHLFFELKIKQSLESSYQAKLGPHVPVVGEYLARKAMAGSLVPLEDGKRALQPEEAKCES